MDRLTVGCLPLLRIDPADEEELIISAAKSSKMQSSLITKAGLQIIKGT
jgi:hypothetical protein